MNRGRLIFNAVLVLGLIALGVALWLTREPAPTPEPPVSGEPVAGIGQIELHVDDGIVQLERSGADDWRLREPVAARANRVHVNALLELAAAMPERRYARDAIDARTAGIDDPVLAIRFNDEAPILVGGPGPRAGTRYVATAHALLLVEMPALGSLPTRWRGWVSPTLLGEDARLERLTLPRLTLARSADTGGWTVAPVSADRGADYAQATINAWRHSRALALEPVDASRARSARVTLRFADRPPRRIDVIEREPDLILRDAERGIDYHFAPNLAAPLLEMQHPDALRAQRDRDVQPSAIPLAPAD